MCTYGGSFGAYSAMMLAIRAPGLFRCAVGSAGLYDIPMLLDSNRDDKDAYTYLQKVAGPDVEALASISPAHLAARIGIPVLLVHGRDDQRTPVNQALRMRDALKAAGNPARYINFTDEGHGFVEPENIEAFYQALEAFFATHLLKR